MTTDYLEWLPSFDGEAEEACDDPVLLSRFSDAVSKMVKEQPDITLLKSRMSINADFGPILRIDFATPDTGEGIVNRIMIWGWSDGTLGNFFGFDIPAQPL